MKDSNTKKPMSQDEWPELPLLAKRCVSLQPFADFLDEFGRALNLDDERDVAAESEVAELLRGVRNECVAGERGAR